MSKKSALITRILAELERDLAAAAAAAAAAHEAATHEESRAEDSHDTRGLEASYLAGAQAKRMSELKSTILLFKHLKPRDFKPDEAIAVGAWISLLSQGKRSEVFLVEAGGGISVRLEAQAIQVITRESPLGDALLGRKAGDFVEVELGEKVREYQIVDLS